MAEGNEDRRTAGWQTVPPPERAEPHRVHAGYRVLTTGLVITAGATTACILMATRTVAVAVALVGVVVTHVYTVEAGLRGRTARRSRTIWRGTLRAGGTILTAPAAAALWVFASLGRRPLPRVAERRASGWLTPGTSDPPSTEPLRLLTEQPGSGRKRERSSSRKGAIIFKAAAIALAAGVLSAGLSRVVATRWMTEQQGIDVERGAGLRTLPIDSAALANQAQAEATMEEAQQAGSSAVYTPYVGISLRDFSGEFVNIRDRVRKSYEPPASDSDPIEVWFFGGSTMFGFDLQRDLHTIPSEVARLAERDGYRIRATNFGAPGYVNFQEVTLFLLALGTGRRPDVVVFYDGVNDKALAVLNSVFGINPVDQPSDLYADRMRTAWAESGFIPDAVDDPPESLLVTRANSEPPSIDDIISNCLGTYRSGVDLAHTVADRHGVRVIHFWQPDLFTRDRLDPGEQALIEPLTLDQGRLESGRALSQRLREALPDDVIDLGDALDAVDGPVYSDQSHINEVGASAVAAAMWPHLRPLVDASAER